MHRIVAVTFRVPWNGTERLCLPARIARACDDLDRARRRCGDVGGEPPPGESIGQRTELRGLPGAPAVAGELDLGERRVAAVGVTADGERRTRRRLKAVARRGDDGAYRYVGDHLEVGRIERVVRAHRNTRQAIMQVEHALPVVLAVADLDAGDPFLPGRARIA